MESHITILLENPAGGLKYLADVFRTKFLQVGYGWRKFVFHVRFLIAQPEHDYLFTGAVKDKYSLSEKSKSFSMHLLSVVEIYQLRRFLIKSVNTTPVRVSGSTNLSCPELLLNL